MSKYDLELAQNIRKNLDTPHAFRLLKVGHYLTPLRELVAAYSDDELNDAIQSINLLVENLLSEILLEAVESFYCDEHGYCWAIMGPYDFRFFEHVEAEDLTEDTIWKYLSISDLYIYLVANIEPEIVAQLNVKPHEILLLAGLKIYSDFTSVLSENDSFPLYLHFNIESSLLFDDIAKVNTLFSRWLIDFIRLIDESFRLQGGGQRLFVEEEVSLAKKGQIASDARFGKARELAREIAQDWIANGSKPGAAAKSIRTVIAADPHRLGLSVVPTEATIFGWIANMFPESLRTRGRPRKK